MKNHTKCIILKEYRIRKELKIYNFIEKQEIIKKNEKIMLNNEMGDFYVLTLIYFSRILGA